MKKASEGTLAELYYSARKLEQRVNQSSHELEPIVEQVKQLGDDLEALQTRRAQDSASYLGALKIYKRLRKTLNI